MDSIRITRVVYEENSSNNIQSWLKRLVEKILLEELGRSPMHAGQLLRAMEESETGVSSSMSNRQEGGEGL